MNARTRSAGGFARAENDPPQALAGFGHVNRYWDRTRNCHAAKILPGEYYVTLHDEAITTVLGSCIAACIRDRCTGIGGMNHFLLPGGGQDLAPAPLNAATRFGIYAMERLVNDILRNGGIRRNLEAKIFGGGRIIADMSDIGMRNIDFVKDYVRGEELRLAASDVGDVYPRKVMYFPASGRVFVKKLPSLHNNTILERETRYLGELTRKPQAGAIELF